MNLKYTLFHCLLLMITAGFLACNTSNKKPLFDGNSFQGWEGDTINTWRIENGTIVGGSLSEKVPHNDFVCTTTTYSDFILTLEFKLEGNEGFINAGVQFRSQRVSDPDYEMTGYQADIGEGINGALYDESRRNKYLVEIDSVLSDTHTKAGEWNQMEVQAKGNHIKIFLNGHQTVDYTEPDSAIPQRGVIGLQVHGGGKALVRYREIHLEEL